MRKISIIRLGLLAFSAIVFFSCVSDLDRQGGYVDNLPRIDVGVQFGIAPMIDANGTTIPLSVSGSDAEEGGNLTADRPQKLAPLDVDTIKISNVWVFQFGRAENAPVSTTEANWVLIGNPYYARAEDLAAMYADPNRVLSLPMIETGITKNPGDKNWVMFIANTDDPNFTSNRLSGLQVGITTFSLFKEKYIDITDEAYAYGGEGHSIMMTGGTLTPVKSNIVIDGDSDEPDDNIFKDGVKLYRNVAMIRLNLTIDQTLTPGYKVLSVQMKSVHRRMFILYNWIYDQTPYNYDTYYPISATESSSYAPQFFDYNVAYQDGGFQKDGTKEYIWYVPANVINPATTASNSFSIQTKNAIAPTYGTRYEIVVVDTIKYETIKYTIYPGMNETNNFRLYPNHIYTNNFRIFGNGGETILDSRVERQITNMGLFDAFVGNYTTPPDMDKANSFIIPRINTPLITSASYNIPDYIEIPVSQVNRYWSGTATGYGNDLTKTIETDTVWVVELLWQDDPDLVRSVNSANASHITITASGALNSGGELKTFSANRLGAVGKGQNAKFRINTTTSGMVGGNFVVAIRKAVENASGEFEATGDILWSWHFWVTGYNPDVLVAQYENAIDGHQFIYSNESGDIVRLGGTYWGYSGSASNNWNNYTYAYTTPTYAYPYAKSFMMDRNFGASSNGLYNGNTKHPTMFYIGRKDPFTGSPIYDINGDATAFPKGVGTTFVEFIKNPMLWVTSYPNNSWTTQYYGTNSVVWGDFTLVRNSKTAAYFTSRTGGFGKSIFDPCPAGWQLTIDRESAFVDLRQSSTLNTTDAPWVSGGATYIPNLAPRQQKTYFATDGYLYTSYTNGGSSCYIYTAYQYSDREPGYVEISSSGARLDHNPAYNYWALPVRCVSMPR